LASKASLIEEPFAPAVRNGYHEVVREIDWRRAPPLDGYVATTSKRTAETLLVSDQQDPILAVWRYGLGRAAAFTSDAKAKWARRWLSWEGYGKFFSQLVRWTLGNASRGEIAAVVQNRQGRGEIVLEAADRQGAFMNFMGVDAGIIFPDRRRAAYPLVQVAPGRYRTEFPAGAQGAYLIGSSQRRGGRAVGSEVAALAVPYPEERRALPVNSALLNEVAERTGGAILSDPAEAFRLNRRRTGRGVETWPWALLAALVILLADVAARSSILRPGSGRTSFSMRRRRIGRSR
jgi:hypothetical protein